METNEDLRLLVENFYDQQEVRKESANRIRTIVRNRLVKIDFRDLEGKKANDEKAYGEKWNDNLIKKKIEWAKDRRKLKSEEYDYLTSLIKIKNSLEGFENDYKKQILLKVKEEQIFKEYLTQIIGVAELTGANIIGYLGYCENFDTISKLWTYCGLGRVNRCKNCTKFVFNNETIKKDWIKKQESKDNLKKKKDAIRKQVCSCDNPEPVQMVQRKIAGRWINYNPKVKTLMYRISDCFIKVGFKQENGVKTPSGYRKLYDQVKAGYKKKYPKEIANPEHERTGKYWKKCYTKGHIDMMARRKVEKIFLANYWLVAREMKGLPTRPPYPIGKGGHTTLIKPFTDI